jgi:hypothetical protein
MYIYINRWFHTCVYVFVHMNKKVTLSIDKAIYEGYIEYCRKEGIILSRKVESFFKRKLGELRGGGD